MARAKRPADELTIAELEALLARKKTEARRERIRQLQQRGRALDLGQPPASRRSDQEHDQPDDGVQDEHRRRRLKSWGDRLLLILELGAVAGLAWVLITGFGAVTELNREVAEALGNATASPTPLITAVVLPSGHTPPTSPGGARPNEAEIPEHLRPMVQSSVPLAVPTSGPGQAQSLYLPAIWNSSAPIVQGDGWEQLKKGVGQHIGTANPGQTGNMVLSAHNDIFGELFRHLDQLKPGDEIIVSTGLRDYTYRVTGTQVVEPTEVSVMNPTSNATVTLISCYPYLIDNKRIVVTGELVDG